MIREGRFEITLNVKLDKANAGFFANLFYYNHDSGQLEFCGAVRYAQMKKVDVSAGENTNILSYPDAFDISEYAISAFQWACGEGIITGKPENLLDPKGTATRAEVAAMLERYIEAGK